ncbi:unnamed protein product, partial [Ectocarpus fasciculatus]
LLVNNGCHEYRRRKPVPGCLHCRIEPGFRWTSKALVCIYAGATAGVAGVLWRLPKFPDVTRACRSTHAS